MEIAPTSPILRFALGHWQGLAETIGTMPTRKDVDVVRLKPCLGHMLLLEIADPIEDSRYRVFGTTLVEYFNEELTGERLGDTGGAKNGVLIAEYSEVVRRAEPLMFANDPVIGGSVFLYEKVALPLRGADGSVGHILAVIDQLPAL